MIESREVLFRDRHYKVEFEVQLERNLNPRCDLCSGIILGEIYHQVFVFKEIKDAKLNTVYSGSYVEDIQRRVRIEYMVATGGLSEGATLVCSWCEQ